MNFDRFNETDVREEIIAPMLRALGYRTDTQHDILREQLLRYPHNFLGRKDVKRDPILRGKADYILEADKRVRWVIEAKAPSSLLDSDEVEQAWTYANHPEVRAVYFCLCNGRHIRVYQTHNGPNVSPILDIGHEQLLTSNGWSMLKDVLSPEAVLRDHPRKEVDAQPPLGPNLRSIARITGGHISYNNNSLNIQALSEFQVSIVGGAIERDEHGRMVALVETRAPIRSIQSSLERLRLTQFEMICENSTLSTSEESPSLFTYSCAVTFPAGEEMLNIEGWQKIVLPQPISASVTFSAWGVLHGARLVGSIQNCVQFNEQEPSTAEGTFEIHLS